MEKQERQPANEQPELLYHYTTQTGLIGILNEKGIWATHIAYLNDSSEFKRGLAIVQHYVQELKIDPTKVIVFNEPSGPQIEFIEQSLRKSIEQALAIMNQVDVFVASFFDSSAVQSVHQGRDSGDNLEQWRAYSGNAGVSIGFDKDRLSNYIAEIGENPSSPIAFGQCNYDQNTQERYLRDRVADFGPAVLEPFNKVVGEFKTTAMPRILNELKSNLTKEPPALLIEQAIKQASAVLKERFEQETGNLNAVMVSALVGMMVPSAFMKHPAFDAENEWRVAQFSFGGTVGVRFRPGTFSLIPYIAIPLSRNGQNPDLLIKRIVVAPSPKSDQAVAAVKMLLRSHGLKICDSVEKTGVEVIASNIPYRNW